MNLRGRGLSVPSSGPQGDENAQPSVSKKRGNDFEKPTAEPLSSSRQLRTRKNEVTDSPAVIQEGLKGVAVKGRPSTNMISSDVKPSCSEKSKETTAAEATPAKKKRRVKLEDGSLENHCVVFASTHMLFIGFLDIAYSSP